MGIASPAQPENRRHRRRADAESERQYDYRGFAGPSALLARALLRSRHLKRWTFGNYMNGGSLLAWTYWEIMGRCRAGDSEGAYRRLKLFACTARPKRLGRA